MGNSSSQSNEEVLDSRVIKISESLAQKLVINRNNNNSSSSSGKAEQPRAFLNEPPSVRQHQPYREDGQYLDEDLFQEFQKQEVLNELTLQSLDEKLHSAFSPFQKSRPPKSAFEMPEEQKNLLNCLKTHPTEPLKCTKEVKDFTDLAKKVVSESQMADKL